MTIYILFSAKDYPDIEIVLGSGALNNDASRSMGNMLGIPNAFFDEVYRDIMGQHAFSLVPIIMRPKSRGRLQLKSKNPFQWPKMKPNYFQHADDMNTLVEGLKLVSLILLSIDFHPIKFHFISLKVHRLGESQSFQKYGGRLHRHPYLGCENHIFGSDNYWKCCIKGYTSSLQHQVKRKYVNSMEMFNLLV